MREGADRRWGNLPTIFEVAVILPDVFDRNAREIVLSGPVMDPYQHSFSIFTECTLHIYHCTTSYSILSEIRNTNGICRFNDDLDLC